MWKWSEVEVARPNPMDATRSQSELVGYDWSTLDATIRT